MILSRQIFTPGLIECLIKYSCDLSTRNNYNMTSESTKQYIADNTIQCMYLVYNRKMEQSFLLDCNTSLWVVN